MENQYLTGPQLAKALGLDRSTIFRRVKAGTLKPATFAGKLPLFTHEDLDKLRAELQDVTK